MTVSADPGVDTGGGEQPPARQLGIRAKLFLAFLGFAGLTLAACAVAWMVFTTIERAVNRVTQESVPGMVDALALSKTVADFSASAPALFASSDQEELAAERTRLEGYIHRFTRIAAALGPSGHYEEDQRAIAIAAVNLLTELVGLAESVERRLALGSRRETMMAELHGARIRFNQTIEPLVDDAVFDLVITGEKVMADNTASINNLVDGGVGRIDHLLRINVAVNLAAGLMGEAVNVVNPVLLEPIHERFLSASLAIESSLRQLPDGPRSEALKRAIASLLAPGREGLFTAGGATGTGRVLPSAGASAAGERLNQRHEQVLLMLTPMIDDAAFDLVITTEALTARSEKAIAGLVDRNVDILSLMLTAQAEGNLVASLLSDAAVTADGNLLLPLVERFTASAARLESVSSKVEEFAFYEELSRSTNTLLDLGRGEASLFELRRTELKQMAVGEAALDASRDLSRELGALAAAIVARAKTASRAASASSAGAIEQGQVALALITLVGLTGAVIAMFGYVDPRIIRPIGRITSAMTRLAAGDTSVDIPGRERTDEIGVLAATFNGMTRRLNESIEHLKETTAAKERIESELKIAHEIQMSMVPKIFPAFPDRSEFDIFATLAPAKEVGGDLYDFFFSDDDHLCFAIGDVSGKGVPASLFMAVTKTLLKATAGAGGTPGEILARLNAEISRDNDSCMFVTLFFGILNIRTGQVDYCNGGHTLPYRVHRSGATPLKNTGGMALGVVEHSTYASGRIILGAGETLLLYTDGVTEAMNSIDALYSTERLERFLAATRGASPRQMIDALVADVWQYAGGAPQSDDITALALAFVGTSEAMSKGLEIKITNELAELDRLRQILTEFGQRHGLSSRVVHDLNLTLEEILANIISHGYADDGEHEIIARLIAQPDTISIEVEDDAQAFDPLAMPEPDVGAAVADRAVGGLGIHLVRKLMDNLEYQRRGGKNVLRMKKNRR